MKTSEEEEVCPVVMKDAFLIDIWDTHKPVEMVIK
jgi:hypothetical protein